MKVLGIETSCDETSAAVVEDGRKLYSNVVHSQIDIHAEYGGVVPEIAARSHIEVINPVVRRALQQANCTWDDIDAIAVTYAPGLVGSLLVGTLCARTLAIVYDKPLYAVHHVEGHVYANFIVEQKEQPSEISELSAPARATSEQPSHPEGPAFPAARNNTTIALRSTTERVAVGGAADNVGRVTTDNRQSSGYSAFPASVGQDKLVVGDRPYTRGLMGGDGGEAETLTRAASEQPSHPEGSAFPAERGQEDSNWRPRVPEGSDGREEGRGNELPRAVTDDHSSSPALVLPTAQPNFPMLALIVSGGHSQLVLFRDHGDYELLGQTQDDAVGEAFDKVAKILGLPYPGGPSIDRASQKGDPRRYDLPKAQLKGKYDFSFSGLKTAVLRAVQREAGKDFRFPSHELSGLLTSSQKHDFAASFQRVALETLVDTTVRAYQDCSPASVVIAGGVAASRELRRMLRERLPTTIEYAPMSLCTDNAAMIAALGYYRAQKMPADNPYDLEVQPSLSMVQTTWA